MKTRKILIIILLILSIVLTACNNENNNVDPKGEIVECDHILEKVKGKAATCTEDGYQGYYRCTLCGYTEGYKVTEAVGHDFVLKKGSRATLKADGCSDYYECKRCGEIKDKEIYPKLDHIHKGEVLSTVEKTNTSCEIRTCKCDICGKEFQDYQNALHCEEKYMDNLNILMVGNSFTNYNCLYTLLEEMIKEEGINVKVVSMPSMFLFDKQDNKYKEDILPSNMKNKTMAIEMGSTMPWYKYANYVYGIDEYGKSMPLKEIYDEYGFTVDNIYNVLKKIK